MEKCGFNEKFEQDEVCQQIKVDSKLGWPDKHNVPIALKPCFSVFSGLKVQHDMFKNRIVVPSFLGLLRHLSQIVYRASGNH